MSKANELSEKLNQRREAANVAQEYWLELFPEFGELNRTQALTWVTMYDVETVVAGLESAMIKVNRVRQAVEGGRGEEMTLARVVKYASMCMRNAGLSDEERKALDEKRDRVRAARSEAGKHGNAKRWGQPAGESDDLRSVATTSDDLRRATGSGSGSDTGSDRGRATATGSGNPVAPAALPPALPDEKRKAEPKPQTKSNTVGVSGVSPNQGQTNPKIKMIKTARGPQPKPDGFDEWDNNNRLQFMVCTCAGIEFFSDATVMPDHNRGCPALKGQAKSAWAGAANEFNVPEL